MFALSVPPLSGAHRRSHAPRESATTSFYTVYFQQPAVAEAELDADMRKSLRMSYYAVSGDAPALGSCAPNRPARRCSTA